MKELTLKSFLEKRGIFLYYSVLFVLLSISGFLGIRWYKLKNNPVKDIVTKEVKMNEKQIAEKIKNPKKEREYYMTVETTYLTRAVTFPGIEKTKLSEEIIGATSKLKE